jgi:Cys-tRNA(Pro)/Cys-tRNA(Cys) deacylase
VAGRGTAATALLERQGPTVYCSGGRRGLEIEFAPEDLIRAASAAVAPISR